VLADFPSRLSFFAATRAFSIDMAMTLRMTSTSDSVPI
jgi:hypothetical protein